MPQISVIIPVYNTEKYLPACLDSVCSQSFQDIEIICINDGSPDKSGEILAKYAEQDKRIVVVNQENKGLSGARNTGIQKANGQWICFVDSDDRIPNFALQTLYQIAQTTNSDIVMSEKRLSHPVLSSGAIHWQVHTNIMEDFVNNPDVFSAVCNKLYRSELIKDHQFIEGIYFEDWPFLMSLMPQVKKFATTQTPCYIYREDNESTTRSPFTNKKVDSYITGIRYVYDFYKDRPDLKLAQKRMAVAAKMLTNKVYHSKDRALKDYALSQLDVLFDEKIISKSNLPLKSFMRYWMMKKQK
ncbi:MAG: glycosyltransferase [Alphaproteobacteria bacterium]|nr:glycosyltransferase [Alphaproteobacteria bacterium]